MPYASSDRQRKFQRDRHQRRRAEVNARKTPCVRCGFEDLRAIDFHHTDQSTKIDTINRMLASNRSMSVIHAEIDKCECLCANCHRIEHIHE